LAEDAIKSAIADYRKKRKKWVGLHGIKYG
jgi:hypothetical protein